MPLTLKLFGNWAPAHASRSPFPRGLSRLKSELGYRIHQLRRRYSYQLVSSPDKHTTAVLFGQAVYVRPLVDDFLNYIGPRPAQNVPRLPSARLARQLACDHGLVIFHEDAVPRALRAELIHQPKSVGMALELTGPLAQTRAALSLQTRTQLKNIEARGLRLEITRDLSLIPEFYERYYIASMTKRHETLATVVPLDWFYQYMQNDGELLRVFDGDQWIAGIIATRSADGYRLEQSGWLDGDPQFVNAGAIKFLYWQGITRAAELGLPRVHFGGSSNDLSNGILFQKSRWGARIVRTGDRYHDWPLLINPEHPAVGDLLTRRTLLFTDPANGFFVLSTRPPSEVPAYSSQSPSISAWYRLRETPAPADRPDSATPSYLPATLHPWFDSVPLKPARKAA